MTILNFHTNCYAPKGQKIMNNVNTYGTKKNVVKFPSHIRNMLQVIGSRFQEN
jgi:hypothetical protein